jgi:hypothetical protein
MGRGGGGGVESYVRNEYSGLKHSTPSRSETESKKKAKRKQRESKQEELHKYLIEKIAGCSAAQHNNTRSATHLLNLVRHWDAANAENEHCEDRCDHLRVSVGVWEWSGVV